jgi:hypothetical protein
VWLLSRRDYSAGILRKKLVLRVYDTAEADEAMAFVIANGYQNDERYAESLARALSRRAGNSRLLMTMRQKKIDPATAIDTARHRTTWHRVCRGDVCCRFACRVFTSMVARSLAAQMRAAIVAGIDPAPCQYGRADRSMS